MKKGSGGKNPEVTQANFFDIVDGTAGEKNERERRPVDVLKKLGIRPRRGLSRKPWRSGIEESQTSADKD